MLFVEWQEKWKGGGGDESVTRLQLFKITLKFCKTRLFHSSPLICCLFTWPRELDGFCGSPPFQGFAQCPQSDRRTCCWTCTQYSIKWPRLPLCLGLVALVNSGVMEGQSYGASPVITGSWHSVSTAAKFSTEILERVNSSFVTRMKEESLLICLDFRTAKMAKIVVTRWRLSLPDDKCLTNPKDNDDIKTI